MRLIKKLHLQLFYYCSAAICLFKSIPIYYYSNMWAQAFSSQRDVYMNLDIGLLKILLNIGLLYRKDSTKWPEMQGLLSATVFALYKSESNK